jgi:hypothetical protein
VCYVQGWEELERLQLKTERVEVTQRKHLSYIHLGSSVCHIPVIFLSVVVAERSSILLVLIIKLTKETRWRVCRGRDYRDGEIGDGEIEEGGCEETFHCKSLT